MSELTIVCRLAAVLNSMVPMRVRVVRRQLMKWPKLRKWLRGMKGQELCDSEREVVEFLRKSPFNYSMIPYPFALKYRSSGVTVCFDKAKGMHYVVTQGKRLYYPASWQPYSIKAMHNQLLSEQDVDSPHRYERGGCEVRDGDVVVDAGAAEGFFALSVIERARRVVLVESSPEWLPALRATFEPFSDKAVFLQKLIADVTDDDHITLDEILRMEGRIDFVKADIEGGERSMLKGGAETLAQPDVRLAVAVYHREDDASMIGDCLTQQGYNVSHSPRRVLIEDFEDRQFSLRRGICYAEKRKPVGLEA